MPPLPPSTYPIFEVLAVVGAAVCVLLSGIAIRARHGRRGQRVAALGLALVFAVASGGLAIAAYQDYMREYALVNTWTYSYDLDAYPNVIAAEAIVLPIPQDSSVIAGLQLFAGEANWSFADTIHGRGLYVRFSGNTSLHSTFSELPASGHNITMTMTNFNTTYGFPESIWVYYSGSNGTALFLRFGILQSGWFGVLGKPLAAGWSVYPLSHAIDP